MARIRTQVIATFGRDTRQLEENDNTTDMTCQGYHPLERISSKLAQLRAAKGMSTREFAEAVTKAGHFVTHSTVGSYEREGGTERIPAGYLAAVCRLFGLSPTWLLLDVGPPDLEVDEAGDLYRRGRSEVAAEVVELLLPDLLDESGAPATRAAADWGEALAILRRRLMDQGEEGAG